MYLRQLEVERYKAYANRSILELLPLTILVGCNSSGKSAIAKATALLAGSLRVRDSDGSPLPLQALGLNHGVTLHDLLWRHSPHGSLEFGAVFAGHPSGMRARLDVVIQSLDSLGGDPVPLVMRWSLAFGDQRFVLERPSVVSEEVRVADGDQTAIVESVAWHGLSPTLPGSGIPRWVSDLLVELRTWAQGVRYLVSPRCLASSPFRLVSRSPLSVTPDGEQTPLILASHDGIRAEVAGFFRKALGTDPDVHREASFGSLGVRQNGNLVGLAQAGQGLTQLLPVATLLASAPMLGAGLDVIEHPAAELHPQAHGDVADFLLESSGRAERPIVVETHSELILLRVRRAVAEQRIDADDVGIYWVEPDPEHGSSLRRIPLTPEGDVEEWPEGVFYEDYEEILAIRRAARKQRS
ncbi:MAG: DUF3696 domain-containing protein [Myxococcota bacterium]